MERGTKRGFGGKRLLPEVLMLTECSKHFGALQPQGTMEF